MGLSLPGDVLKEELYRYVSVYRNTQESSLFPDGTYPKGISGNGFPYSDEAYLQKQVKYG